MIDTVRLAELLKAGHITQYNCDLAAVELRRLHHNNLVLMDALWKACGDDEAVVNATIESQGTLK